MENENNTNKFKAKLDRTADKIKKATIRTKIMTMALVFVVIVVFISIFFPLSQDPETFTDPVKRAEWINNTVIAMTLSIVGLILFESIITDKLKGKERGKYQNALQGMYSPDGKFIEGYYQKREKIRPIERHFADWLEWYGKEELRKKKINTIGSVDAELVFNHLDEIDNPLLLCDHTEIKKEHWFSRIKIQEVKGAPLKMKDGAIISKKSESEVAGIFKVKDDKVKIYPYEAPYYLTIDSVPMNVSQIDKANVLNKGKQENQVFSRTFKIAVGIITSVYWAMVTVDNFSNLTSARAWLLLIVRLGTLVGGLVSGWSGADMNVKFDIDILNDRSAMLDNFYSDMTTGRFNPKKYQEDLAEEHRKEAEEQYGDNKEEQNS